MSATLEVRDLRKQFATGRPAVDGVSFEVPAGEIVVLLGPSGCGKTTLLRCIAGFLRPDEGRILVGGERIDTLPAHKRDIGMVFQDYAVFPHLTVAENVAFGLRRSGVKDDDRE